MSRLLRVLSDVAELLEERQIGWALVGGLAVSARTEPRFTRDIDVVVSTVNDEAAEGVSGAFVARGFTVVSTVEQDAVERLATVRLEPPREPSGGVVVDLLFASSGIEPEIAAAAERIDLTDGRLVPVARIGHLIAQKILSRDDERRPQDIADLRALLAVASRGDLSTARSALALVDSRGFSRQRDVIGELDRLVLG